MPTYMLMDEAANQVVEHFDVMGGEVSEAHFGDVITLEGRELRKLPTFPGVDVEPDWAHRAFQLDPDDPDVPHTYTDKHGLRTALFLNRREIENYQAKHNAKPLTDRHQELRYDFGHYGRR